MSLYQAGFAYFNAAVVDDAIRFVSQKSKDKDKIKSAIKGDKEEESSELYYEEHREITNKYK
jgi:hypothetical protein